jgi:hypothetical protein
MPKFHVYATVKGTKYLGEFEAEDEDAAIEVASAAGSAYINLCHQCGTQCEDAQCDDFTAEPVAV